MALRKFQVVSISGWLTALVVLVAVLLIGGVQLPVSTQIFLVLAAIVPTFFVLTMTTGAPARSVTQILYDEEQIKPGVRQPRSGE